jgi:DNA-binding response OmpR family regulator
METERRAIDLADKVAGRDESRMIQLDELRVLVVDEVEELFTALVEAKPKGFVFNYASSGGEGLDRVSSGSYHYAMIAEDLSDLPAKTVARTIRNQQPDTVVLTFRGPADNGPVELVETAGSRVIVKPFSEPAQLLARMDELSDAWRAKAKERRDTTAFRERHYDFLRRYVELKTKIERAMNDGPG